MPPPPTTGGATGIGNFISTCFPVVQPYMPVSILSVIFQFGIHSQIFTKLLSLLQFLSTTINDSFVKRFFTFKRGMCKALPKTPMFGNLVIIP